MSLHPNDFFTSEDKKKLQARLQTITRRLQRVSFESTGDIAIEIAEYFKSIVKKCRGKDMERVRELISANGKRLQAAASWELVIGNVVRRILYVFKDLSREGHGDAGAGGLASFANSPWTVVEHIEDLVGEIRDEADQLAAMAPDYIRHQEIILVNGFSPLVLGFLAAAKKSSPGAAFEVVVTERAPFDDGHIMAARVAAEGIPTTLIPDATAFAYMPKISKILLEPHAVLQDGSSVVPSGSASIAHAAKAHSVPVVALTRSITLTPSFAHDAAALAPLGHPELVVPKTRTIDVTAGVEYVNPLRDVIGPEFVSIMLWHQGVFTPDYAFRLFQDLYDECEFCH
eukprot:gnl/Chilomastix_cuspidata/1519.p1 GENE.gnl/Chilomastix_cuspidata/1519~~gnl/Chilomastix_cuspidata/1519.p1  ORF type:complete len:343 (+),score=164.18 gnl/Chilomastix_cuspidata/1519:30-1058(+)